MAIFSFLSIQPRVVTRPVMVRRSETPGSGTRRRWTVEEEDNKFVISTLNCRKCDIKI